jgi:hypothetical protein
MSKSDKEGAVRPKQQKNAKDPSEGDQLPPATRARKRDEAEAEARTTQSPVRLLFLFLIPVVALIAYAILGS